MSDEGHQPVEHPNAEAYRQLEQAARDLLDAWRAVVEPPMRAICESLSRHK